MVAHLKPSASHAAHLHRFTNAALFKVLLKKLYLCIYLFIYVFEKYSSYFFVLNCSALITGSLRYSLFLFELLRLILSYLSYHFSISYILYSNLIRAVGTSFSLLYKYLWQTLTLTKVAWFFFSACFFAVLQAWWNI